MALFVKQNFSPPILSKRWLLMRFRPNMLLYSRQNIICILESGLLFREDSIEVEQEILGEEVWKMSGRWMTSGEKVLSVFTSAALVAVAPPRNVHRWTLLRMASYMLVPPVICAVHRSQCRGSLRELLEIMRDYMALARRATACCREYAALHARLESVASAIESTQKMLSQQQNDLLVLMMRATSSLLGNLPWLHGDVICEWESDSLMKIHHAFLVIQSTLLKYIALAHIPLKANNAYKNHNERIYWLHNVVITHLIHEFKENFESLERMYRLLKNYGTKDGDVSQKRQGLAINNWFYSDVHTGVARTCLELKIALDKCNNLDAFLDSCALNKQNLDLNVLNKDIDDIIDEITKCLTTVQNSQIRLKKLQNKCSINDHESEKEEEEIESSVLKIEDKEPDIKDEVFYFVKTDDDEVTSLAGDILTGPGKKEKEVTKVVLKELQRKLVKREDLMRERERQALAKTMPNLKNIPEFPRQIKYEDFVERKGFISKLRKEQKNKKSEHKIKHRRKKCAKYILKICKYERESEIKDAYEANAQLNLKSKLFTITKYKTFNTITIWIKHVKGNLINDSNDLSELSDSYTEKEAIEPIKTNGHLKNYRFTKRELELSLSSDSDFEYNVALLKDIRKQRVARKKKYPVKKVSTDQEDESLKPIEYSFGAGLAMASVLQINSKAKMPNLSQEEIFIGDGEVSNDSGNDEDA